MHLTGVFSLEQTSKCTFCNASRVNAAARDAHKNEQSRRQFLRSHEKPAEPGVLRSPLGQAVVSRQYSE